MTMLSKIAALFTLPILLGCAVPAAEIGPSAAGSANVAAERIYGHGRLATPSEIAAWDIDIMADGEGLPVGSGDVVTGRALYATACARCHGESGQGGPFDPLVGRIPEDAFPFADDPRIRKTIGNYWPWATTIFDYTRRAMPQDRPGSLTNDEVYSLTAYLLFMNDLLDAEAVLDRDSLPKVVMPSQQRFVPDDRQGGPEIR